MSGNNKIVSKNNSVVDFVAINAEAVTPSDTDVLEPGQLYVGGDGTGTSNLTVRFKYAQDIPVTFANVPDGSFLPIVVIGVDATNTTSTNILILR